MEKKKRKYTCALKNFKRYDENEGKIKLLHMKYSFHIYSQGRKNIHKMKAFANKYAVYLNTN